MSTKIHALIIGFIIIILSMIATALFYDNSCHKIISNNKSNNAINTNALTMMYETEHNSGEYTVSANDKWLDNGYVFNESLSKCENGSSLSWNNETKKIVMKANTSDRCYIYFDVYLKATINDVTYASTSSSLTATVNATVGDAEIVSYHYSINDGEYVTSDSNTYTFNNLTSNTTYNIKIYITDSNGITSVIYSGSGTTSYINPSVSNVTTSVTTDTITVSVTASGGSSSIKSYHYSSNNGITYATSTSSSYTFSNLTSSTTYNIKVYVTDNNGATSNVYSTSATTEGHILNVEVLDKTPSVYLNNVALSEGNYNYNIGDMVSLSRWMLYNGGCDVFFYDSRDSLIYTLSQGEDMFCLDIDPFYYLTGNERKVVIDYSGSWGPCRT